MSSSSTSSFFSSSSNSAFPTAFSSTRVVDDDNSNNGDDDKGNNNDYYWILSLDGGGVRCVIELILLQRIFVEFPQLERKIRLVAGTSAGAIVASSIAIKGFAETFRIMMNRSFMQRIFATTYAHDALTMNGWRSAMFSNEQLSSLLAEQFAQYGLLSVCRTDPAMPHLLIPAFCVDRKQCREEGSNKQCNGKKDSMNNRDLFHNALLDENDVCPQKETKEEKESEKEDKKEEGKVEKKEEKEERDDDSFTEKRQVLGPKNEFGVLRVVRQENDDLLPDEWCPQVYHTFTSVKSDASVTSDVEDEPLVDVLLRTSAAPTFFPTYKGSVDGGVLANQPALLAVTTAKEHRQFASIDNVRVLSIGTGAWPSNLNGYGKNADLGKLQWISHIATLLMDSSVDLTTIMCRQLLGTRGFHRVQPRLPRFVSLFDHGAFDELRQCAEKVNLRATFEWLEKEGGLRRSRA